MLSSIGSPAALEVVTATLNQGRLRNWFRRHPIAETDHERQRLNPRARVAFSAIVGPDAGPRRARQLATTTPPQEDADHAHS